MSAFQSYLDRLHPAGKVLFQKPRKDAVPSEKYWYGPQPLSHNTLGNMMATISQKAGLETRYTNHCLRDTCVTLLDDNFDARHIMSVSQHRSEASIRSYARRTKFQKKGQMAETISNVSGLHLQMTWTHCCLWILKTQLRYLHFFSCQHGQNEVVYLL